MTSLSSFTDSELISRCLNKDADAWEALIRRYQRLIASITFKFRLSREDAADVFQSVSIALFKQLSQLGKKAKLSSWLITVTVRECWKLRQRSSRTVVGEDQDWKAIAESADPAAISIEGQIVMLEQQHLVRTAIEQLTPECRYLIKTLFYSQVPPSYAEVAEKLHIPIASIGPTRGRCLAKLKTALLKIGYR